jgi:hypothetical protein
VANEEAPVEAGAFMEQRCLPLLRQQTGTVESSERANAGTISNQLSIKTKKIAKVRRIQP